MEIEKRDITYKIKLDNPIDVRKFIWTTSMCKGEVDCISGDKIVDGKSLRSILGIDLSNCIDVVFHDVFGNEDFLKDMTNWKVED